MHRWFQIGFVVLLSVALVSCGNKASEPPVDTTIIRCAVIGGMTMTGLWQKISQMFEADTGYRLRVVVTGPRPLLNEAMRAGKVDFLTMHSGDISTDLVADGFGTNMQPWTRNELCIVGPPGDPAQVRGLTNGAEAFRRIAKTQSHFVDFQGIGSRELAHTIWEAAGVEPKGGWILKDDTVSKWGILQYARSNNAYVMVGYIPAKTGKMLADGMEILVKDDALMRRPFILMEANPAKFPKANYIAAKTLADYLLSDKVQNFLRDFGRKADGTGGPLFFPIQR